MTDVLGRTWARIFSILILHLFKKAPKEYFQYCEDGGGMGKYIKFFGIF